MYGARENPGFGKDSTKTGLTVNIHVYLEMNEDGAVRLCLKLVFIKGFFININRCDAFLKLKEDNHTPMLSILPPSLHLSILPFFL